MRATPLQTLFTTESSQTEQKQKEKKDNLKKKDTNEKSHPWSNPHHMHT